MDQVKVKLTLDRQIWENFGELVPNGQKRKVVNELLKKEVRRKIRQNEEEALGLAFAEASEDKDRQTAIREWD